MSTRAEKPPYGLFGLLWRLSLAAVVVLGSTTVLGYYAAQQLIRVPETSAPDLLLLPLEEAIRRASAEGFSVIIDREERSTLVDPGHVLAQRPTAGTQVKEGSTLRLVIARGL